MSRRDVVLVAAAIVLASVPLFLGFEGEDVFAGADGQAGALIEAMRPDYQPWAEPLWQPPSREIEGLLFALQAALGAGVLGFYLGLRRGERRARPGVDAAR